MKKVLITGSSSGFGKGTAELFLKNDVPVVGIARQHKKFIHKSKLYEPIEADLSLIESLPKLITTILKEHPDIDVFISNAGYGDFQSIENFSANQIQNFLNLNLISHITLCRFIVSHMRYEKNGTIFFIGSESGLVGKKKGTLYSAAKFGLRGFCQALRDEVATSGIRVCLLNPGFVRTPFFESLNFEPKETETNAIEPEDIAKIILDLLHTRIGTNIDEVNLSPTTKSLNFKPNKKEI